MLWHPVQISLRQDSVTSLHLNRYTVLAFGIIL